MIAWPMYADHQNAFDTAASLNNRPARLLGNGPHTTVEFIINIEVVNTLGESNTCVSVIRR